MDGSGKEEPIATDARASVTAQRPFVVLVNANSASLSEACAAAAQDCGFGRVFGHPTASCLADPVTYALVDGARIDVSILAIVSPWHRASNQPGGVPDEAPSPDPNAPRDPTLDAVAAWIAAQPPH